MLRICKPRGSVKVSKETLLIYLDQHLRFFKGAGQITYIPPHRTPMLVVEVSYICCLLTNTNTFFSSVFIVQTIRATRISEQG